METCCSRDYTYDNRRYDTTNARGEDARQLNLGFTITMTFRRLYFREEYIINKPRGLTVIENKVQIETENCAFSVQTVGSIFVNVPYTIRAVFKYFNLSRIIKRFRCRPTDSQLTCDQSPKVVNRGYGNSYTRERWW